MELKRKHKMTRIAFTVSISVMIFVMPGNAPAQGPAFSGTLDAGPPLLQAADPAADRLSYDLFRSVAHEKSEKSKDLLPNAKLLLPGDWDQTKYAPVPRPLFFMEPVPAYYRRGPILPVLGFGWEYDAGNGSKWNVVLGLGIVNDGTHPAEDFGHIEPAAERDQTDLFEKMKNPLQVVGFKIRFDF